MNEITRNDIRRQYTNIIQIGYCDLYELTRELKKIGYNAGVYGWNYDVFELDWDTCIITGYRTFSKGTIRLTRDYIKKTEEKIKRIFENSKYNYQEINNQMNLLKNEFLNEYKNNVLK